MGFKNFLILMAVSTAAAWVAWGLVLFSIDPTKVGGVGIFFNLIVGDVAGPNITINKVGPTSARNITVTPSWLCQVG